MDPTRETVSQLTPSHSSDRSPGLALFAGRRGFTSGVILISMSADNLSVKAKLSAMPSHSIASMPSHLGDRSLGSRLEVVGRNTSGGRCLPTIRLFIEASNQESAKPTTSERHRRQPSIISSHLLHVRTRCSCTCSGGAGGQGGVGCDGMVGGPHLRECVFVFLR